MSEPLLHWIDGESVVSADGTTRTGTDRPPPEFDRCRCAVPFDTESGQVWVNCYEAADSALPFGGTKESGWGRETCRETLEEYLETKTVVVSL
jgi:hypothetical protein